MTDLALTAGVTVTPIARSSRRDVHVASVNPALPEAFAKTDIVGALRRFFADLDAEAQSHKNDPIALTQAMLRLDTLLADVRAVRDSVRQMATDALHRENIRRLALEGVGVVETSSSIQRTEWRHAELLTRVLDARGLAFIDTTTGERLDTSRAAEVVLTFLRPEWKLTPLKETGIDPNQYCTVDMDGDKPVATPSVTIKHNTDRSR